MAGRFTNTGKVVIAVLMLLLSGLTARGADFGKPFFTNWTALEYGGHNRNFGIACDNTGRVFAANFEGLAVYDGTGWKIIHTPGISRVTAILVTENGDIWFGGDNVLGCMEEGDGRISYVADDSDIKVYFGEISEISEADGAIHFRTSTGQTWRVEEGKIEAMDDTPADIAQKPDKSVTEDEIQFSRKVWNGIEFNDRVVIRDLNLTVLATKGKGIVIIDNGSRKYNSLNSEDGLCSDNVNALAYDGKGSLWGATDNGLFQVNLVPVYSHYSKTDGLVGQVTDILKHGSKLYVSTLQGLFILGEDDHFSKIKEISLSCWQMAESLDKRKMLAATAEGLFEIGSDIRQLNGRHSLSVIYENPTIWYTGELNGIFRHTSSGEDRMMAAIPNVVKLEKGKDGSIWAITLGKETFCKKPGKDVFIPAENPDMTLLFRYLDDIGRTWHSDSNNMGLICESISENEYKWCEPLKVYSIQAMELKGNEIWVGGNFGLIRMDKDEMKENSPFTPVIHIRSFKTDRNAIHLTYSNDKTDPIGVTLYSYRMGDKAEWSHWNDDKTVDFSHLAPGNYQLSVRSIDAYGNIALSRPVKFSIPLPFYFRWYAILAYLLLLVFLLYGLFHLRIVVEEKKRKELQEMVDERTRELEEAQNRLIKQEREATVGKLTKGLIDRILNPMNYINNFSHLTIGLTGDLRDNIEVSRKCISEDIYEDSMDVINMMNDNLKKIEQHGMSTSRILKAMEELLREHSGKTGKVDLGRLCRENADLFRNYYRQEIEAFGIEVSLEIPQEKTSAEAVEEYLAKVIKYMLSNCVYAIRKKYEKQRFAPKIRIKLEAEPSGGAVIRIYDNGIGIEDNIKDKVFDPFFTTKPTGEATGIGLYLSQEIIQDAGGNISFESEKDNFTEFCIKLK